MKGMPEIDELRTLTRNSATSCTTAPDPGRGTGEMIHAHHAHYTPPVRRLAF